MSDHAPAQPTGMVHIDGIITLHQARALRAAVAGLRPIKGDITWAMVCAGRRAFVLMHRPVVGLNPALERVTNGDRA